MADDMNGFPDTPPEPRVLPGLSIAVGAPLTWSAELPLDAAVWQADEFGRPSLQADTDEGLIQIWVDGVADGTFPIGDPARDVGAQFSHGDHACNSDSGVITLADGGRRGTVVGRYTDVTTDEAGAWSLTWNLGS
jgi:hypothetical protein